MKKSEFVTLVAEKTGLSKKDTEKTIDAVFAAMGDVMAQGNKLQMSGFGTFVTRARSAHLGLKRVTTRAPARRSKSRPRPFRYSSPARRSRIRWTRSNREAG